MFFPLFTSWRRVHFDPGDERRLYVQLGDAEMIDYM